MHVQRKQVAAAAAAARDTKWLSETTTVRFLCRCNKSVVVCVTVGTPTRTKKPLKKCFLSGCRTVKQEALQQNKLSAFIFQQTLDS